MYLPRRLYKLLFHRQAKPALGKKIRLILNSTRSSRKRNHRQHQIDSSPTFYSTKSHRFKKIKIEYMVSRFCWQHYLPQLTFPCCGYRILMMDFRMKRDEECDLLRI